jgi:hypothetical protein
MGLLIHGIGFFPCFSQEKLLLGCLFMDGRPKNGRGVTYIWGLLIFGFFFYTINVFLIFLGLKLLFLREFVTNNLSIPILLNSCVNDNVDRRT